MNTNNKKPTTDDRRLTTDDRRQTTKKIRVLVVDDSALMRQKLSAMINAADDCEVMATARNGEEALKIVTALRPDVVTLDVQMSGMDGLTCLGYIMSEWPTPVIMVSAFTQSGAETTMKALEYGAIDFVAKPGGVVSINIDEIQYELLQKIRLASKVDISRIRLLYPSHAPKIKKKQSTSLERVVAIGASTGGPRALAQIISQLPPDLAAGVLVVQHMPREFTTSFAERLNWESMITVKLAGHGDRIESGKVYIAPGGFHMTVKSLGVGGEVIEIKPGVKDHYVCPSIDVMMRSVAEVFGKKAIGIVLTGMGEDGTDGLRKIKEQGGITLAEDESTCVVYGMPQAAFKAGVVDEVIELPKVGGRIMELVRSTKFEVLSSKY